MKGLDFADTGNGSCTTNGTSVSYAAGQTYGLQVAFQPTLSGSRYGAGMLTDGSGNVIATGYVRGTGIAPQLSFSPGTQISIANASLAGPTGVAVDAAGNVFIADSKHDRVVKETPSAGAYTETTVATTTPNSPSKVALDGSGSIYIYTGAAVLKETPSPHGYVESTVKTSNYLAGLAVDGSGNVYLTDYSTSDILKETPTSSGYVESIVPSSGLTDPFEVAVDGSGNVYVADANHLRIVKETLSAGAYTQTDITATGLNRLFARQSRVAIPYFPRSGQMTASWTALERTSASDCQASPRFHLTSTIRYRLARHPKNPFVPNRPNDASSEQVVQAARCDPNQLTAPPNLQPDPGDNQRTLEVVFRLLHSGED